MWRSATAWLAAPAMIIAMAAPGLGSDSAAGERGSIGGNFRISGLAATAAESDAAIAYNPDDDEFLVVWRDFRNVSTRGADIYGQRVSGSGARLGANILISGAAATGHEWFPDVAYSSRSGQYFVVWQDNRDVGTRDWDVYLQRISRTGARFGGNSRISGPAATAGDQVPTLAATPDGGLLVVWMDARNLGLRSYDVYGQLLSAGGARSGGNFRISGGAADGADSWPDVAFNASTGEYLVAWQDSRDLPTRGQDVYGQRVSRLGVRLGGNVRLSAAPAIGDEEYPAVGCAASGTCLVLWEDSRNEATRGSDVYGQRVSAAGARLGPNVRISGGAATGDDRFPDAAYEPTTGRFLVLWRTDRDLATRGWDVFSQWVSTSGTRLGANARVSGGAATEDDYSPVAACRSTAGRCLAAWSDGRNSGTTAPDIYGQRLAP